MSTRLERFLRTYTLDSGLQDKERAILDALRYREQNLAIKAGAMLAFCGLMIASVMVQLAAPPESMMYVSRTSVWAFYAKWGLILLLLSSFVSLVASPWGRNKYSSAVSRALGELAATRAHKRHMRLYSAVICLAGAVFASVCLLGPLVQ